jgi:hypothetical protein
VQKEGYLDDQLGYGKRQNGCQQRVAPNPMVYHQIIRYEREY